MSAPISPRLAGKVAIVTGASRGIGAATARQLAADGAKVVCNYLSNAQAAQSVVEGILASGGQAWAVQADVGQVAAAAPLVAEAVRRYGRLDILVNNAALAEAALPDEVDEVHFDRHVATNLKSTLFLTQAAARVMPAEGGSVVNVSSIGTRAANPRFCVYGMTKAGIEMLTASMARDLGTRRIRVNAVAPGQIDTEMLRRNIPAPVLQANIERIALGRLGLTDDIARVVAFLVSQDSGWITGETIHVSGGQRL